MRTVLGLLGRFENSKVRLTESGEPLGEQSMLLDFLDRLTPEHEQVVRQLLAKDNLNI